MIVRTIQQAKRLLKILIGFTLLALGIVMVATPGPGALTIILALGVLAAEFVLPGGSWIASKSKASGCARLSLARSIAPEHFVLV